MLKKNVHVQSNGGTGVRLEKPTNPLFCGKLKRNRMSGRKKLYVNEKVEVMWLLPIMVFLIFFFFFLKLVSNSGLYF